MKEKFIEMNDEQPQLINDQVKRAINIIFQRLKNRIQPTKQYTGEQFLSRSLEVIKKATLKVLSNNDDEQQQQSSDDVQSDDDNEQIQTENDTPKNDQPSNGNSVDQKTLTEEISSISTNQEEEKEANENETIPTNNQKNGWDTVDDLQQEPKDQSEPPEQSQIVLVTEDNNTSTGTYLTIISFLLIFLIS
jgi:hypothetical protein